MNTIGILKWIAIAWGVFASLYFFYDVIASKIYTKGYVDAFSQVIQASKKCEPIPITGPNKEQVNLVNIECLQKQPTEAPKK